MGRKPLRRRLLATLLLVASFAFATLPQVSSAQADDEVNCRAAARGLAWLKTQQQADGSFLDEVDVPSPANGWFYTADALLAILSAGQDPSTYSMNGNTPVSFLEKQVPDNYYGLNSAGYALLAATMLERQGFGMFSKKDALINFINSHYEPSVGHYGGEHLIYGRNLGIHLYAVIGLASVGTVPREAVAYIEGRQGADGGWGNVEETALAVQALVASGGANQSTLDKAQAYLLSQRNPDGGYPNDHLPIIDEIPKEYQNRSEAPAYAVQALLALGAESEVDVSLRFLRSLQNPSGSFGHIAPGGPTGDQENAYTTIRTVPSLLKVSFADPYPTRICVELGVIGMPRAGVDIQGVAAWLALSGLLAVVLGAFTYVRAKATKQGSQVGRKR